MRYFTSDLHLGHKRIIEFSDRPFRDVSEMNEVIIARAWEMVGPDDELWVLGDLAMGVLEDSLAAASRLPGKKILVLGNHDRPLNERTAPRRERFKQVYEDAGFTVMPDVWFTDQVGDREVIVSHFPYAGDSHDADRYEALRAPDTGLPIVHGHVHGTWQVRGRQFNVGVDVRDFRPVPETAIAEWLETIPV